MKIKRTTTMMTILVLVLVLFSMTATAVADIITDNDIRVSLVNQEPDPVEPGQYLTVRMKIENYGTEPTSPIAVGIIPTYPFSILSGYDEEVEIGGLGGRQKADDAEMIEWKLYVDKDAAEGDTELKVYYKELNARNVNVIYNDIFQIEVRTSDTILEVVDINTDPVDVMPGQESKLNIVLKNLGDSFIKDVTVGLDLSAVDISTVGSTSEKIIQKLDGGEEVTLTFNILPDSSAEIKAHKIPLSLKFKDNINTEYSQDSTFGLVLGSDVQYILAVDDSDIKVAGQSGDVSLKISNNGVNNIHFLTTVLKPSSAYEILSAPEIYVGTVDSDDFESVTYKIHVKNTEADSVGLRLLMNYKDSYNEEFEVEEEVELSLYSEKEAKAYGLVPASGNGTGILIFLIIVGGIGYYFYRKNKKKKELEKKKSK